MMGWTGIRLTSKLGNMKATIEIPDELYRRVKAKAALQGRAIREVTSELYRTWLEGKDGRVSPRSSADWLEDWIRLGAEALADAAESPTARDLIDEGRRRLDRA
jgi:hypothetical protein